MAKLLNQLSLSYWIFFAFMFSSHQVTAFSCYKCNSNENYEQCIERPEEISQNIGVVQDCKGYCTILRTEFTDIPGEVVALVRDCVEKPLILNDIRTDKHYTKMYTACLTEKCNVGDGKREPGGESGGSSGPKNLIIVVESNHGVSNKSFTLLLLLPLYLLFKLYYP